MLLLPPLQWPTAFKPLQLTRNVTEPCWLRMQGFRKRMLVCSTRHVWLSYDAAKMLLRLQLWHVVATYCT
jgi:hypothetical protein